MSNCIIIFLAISNKCKNLVTFDDGNTLTEHLSETKQTKTTKQQKI